MDLDTLAKLLQETLAARGVWRSIAATRHRLDDDFYRRKAIRYLKEQGVITKT